MKYKDTLITLGDGKEYIVIEEVYHNNSTYLYMVNKANEMDSMFVEAKNDAVSPIEPKLFEESIFPLFLEKMKDY